VRVKKTLTAHIQGGDTKYARAIPRTGVEYVALVFASYIWHVITGFLWIVGAPMLVLSTPGSTTRYVATALMILGCMTFVVDVEREIEAMIAKRRFQSTSKPN